MLTIRILNEIQERILYTTLMDLYTSASLTFRRKIIVLAGAKIDISDTASSTPVGFIQQKAFKLKEDIRIYSDSTKSQELLSIKARRVIDIGAIYDIVDETTHTALGTIKREGASSIFVRDLWRVADVNGNPYATIEESGSIAIMRRYIEMVPIVGAIAELVFMFQSQVYTISYTGAGAPQSAGTITRKKNPFVVAFVTNTANSSAPIDSRILAGVGALLSVIDASKN